MAGAPAPRTLDIKEPQILRHYPQDGDGFFWHHRVLLAKVGPGIFIALTPDEDLERIDLHTTDHLPLERRSDFPAPQAPYVYAFDEISKADLDRMKRRAASLASLYNDTSVDDIESYEWIVADVNSSKFGESVGEDLVEQGVSLGDSAIVELDGSEVFCEKGDHKQQGHLYPFFGLFSWWPPHPWRFQGLSAETVPQLEWCCQYAQGGGHERLAFARTSGGFGIPQSGSQWAEWSFKLSSDVGEE